MELVVARVQGEALAVGEPHFAYQEAPVRVRIGDPAPAPIYPVDLVAVEERVLARRAALRAADDVTQVALLGQQGGRVDPEPIRNQVEPEEQDGLELRLGLGAQGDVSWRPCPGSSGAPPTGAC